MAEYPDRVDTGGSGDQYPDLPGPPGPSAVIDLVYEGAYPASSPYVDGDIVVYGGVAYLCVRPTSAVPTPWPSPPGGGGGDLNYVHNQVVLDTTWIVVHNLGKFASIEVVNTGGNTIIPNVQYDNANQLTLTFTVPTSGKAYVN